LQSGLVIEAAKILGVKEVWLNTGTFNKMHTTPGQVTSLDVAKRRQILGDILNEAKKVKNAGLKVSIHIFAEDKSMVAEGTDWSYWPQGRYAGSESAEAFKAFAAGVRDNQMDLWIFDIMR
jgi:pyridoxine 5'-phosphate synthase PdxJ